MTRTERLLRLMQLLRHRRHPVSAETIAETLDISVRTAYRDIDTLRAQGEDIRGEAGVGFMLQQDFALPPLMLEPEEWEAVVLGMRWTVAHAEPAVAEAARSALGKMMAMLPPPLADNLASQMQFPIGSHSHYSDDENAVLTLIRQALRGQNRLQFDYTDLQGQPSRRSVWPVAIGYFDQTRILAAWCELRQDFRHFRCDRIANPLIGNRYPVANDWLLAKWQRQECVDLQVFELYPADKN